MDNAPDSKIGPAWLEPVWDAYEEGRPEAMLRLCRKRIREAPEDPEAPYHAGLALLELGDRRAAEAEFLRARTLAPDDPDLLADCAFGLFEACAFQTAEETARNALALDAEVALAHHVMARIAERRNDAAETAFHDRAAFRLDPETYPLPVAIPERACEATVRGTLASLPARYRRLLDETPILLQPLPDDAMLEDGEIAPTVLGAYFGEPLDERSVMGTPAFPARIYVFTANVARSFATLEEALEELRITILHELGHHLGLDEDELAARALA